MKGWIVAVAACLPVLLVAHAVSISSGDFNIQSGGAAHFVLRVPLYETAHLSAPDRELLEQFTFSSQGTAARLLRHACRADRAADQYVCEADYLFSGAVNHLEVTCRLAAALVPSHVHLLRVSDGKRTGQAAFDRGFVQAPVDLQERTALMDTLRGLRDGAWAAVAQVGLLLVLCTVALAARTRRELTIFLLLLIGGEMLILLRRTDYLWKVSPYFVEAALGLTMAYLAGEMLFFRHEGKRWVVVALVAVWLGCYLKINYSAAGAADGVLLFGFLGSQVVLLVLLYTLLHFGRATPWRRRLGQPSAGVLLVVGLCWFFWRWWS